MLTIGIISLIGVVVNFLGNLQRGKLDVDLIIFTICIISWWNIAFWLSILLFLFGGFILLHYLKGE